MTPGEDVPITILNQRHAAWSALLWLGGHICLWLAIMSTADYFTPPILRMQMQAIMMVFAIVTLVIVAARINHLPPKQVKLSDAIFVKPGKRIELKNVRLFRIETDPYEDFAERELPILLCQLTIEPRQGRAVRMIVSAAEARQARLWAENKGIAVVDPSGHSMGDPTTTRE